MNAERLLALYEKIADASDAIARLRRFILDLTVRGKLVPQNTNDEPASELLKRISAKKSELERTGAIKRDKLLPPLEAVDFALPKSWQWTRLGKLCSYIQRGKSPNYAAAEGTPVISQKCVQWSGLDLRFAKSITLESLAKYEEIRFLRDGDLLWNSTGTGTIGRVIRLVDPPTKLVCDSHVTVVRCCLVDPEYIRVWLRSDHVYALIEDRAAGSTNQVELTSQMATHQAVPTPPLAEQHRIVAKVDELMALCDQLEKSWTAREETRDRLTAASLARLNDPAPETFQTDARFALDALPSMTARPDQIKQLRQTILNLAVRGKLAPQDSRDEPASELLKRIAEERTGLVKQHVTRREDELPPVDQGEVPFDIPALWTWSRIGSVVLFSQYGTSHRAVATEAGIPVLTMGNIQNGLVIWGHEKRIPSDAEDLPNLYLKRFDILYNRTNSAELVGKTGIYLGEDECRTFASYLIRLRPSLASTDPRFLNLAMNAPDFRRTQIVPLIKKQTGQANVNGTALKNMLVPIPPYAEQKRIVAKVDELTALCDRLEASLAAGETARSRLLDALLHEALEPSVDRLEAAA